MKLFRNKKLSNWAGISVCAEQSWLPLEKNNIDEIFAQKTPFSIRGLGKNYTDAGLHRSKVLCNHEFNQILDFNESTGIAKLQAGVSLHDLLLTSIPKKWIVPTIPGTAHVTIGGMLASNVHGKNQFRVGSVGEYVKNFTIVTPKSGRILCSPNENRELFDATIGGMGTTGLIETVELQLLKLRTAYLRSSYQKTKTIPEMIEFMESKRNVADFTIAWMAQDSLRGDHANGLIEYAAYANEDVPETWDPAHPLRSIQVPFYLPFCPVNHWTTKVFNRLVYGKNYPSNALIHFYEFNFKLDKIGQWNRLYGKNGFIQYQCLIPKSDQTAKHLQHVLTYLTKHDVLSSLVVVKMHRKDSSGYLSFSRDGISVAMDFPYSDRNVEVLRGLTPWVIEIEGRLYLTKDRTMDFAQFHQMYREEIQLQRKVMAQVDPEKIMQSEFTKRLRVQDE